MPAGVPWPTYLKMFTASLLAMFAGSQVVHRYYLPDLVSAGGSWASLSDLRSPHKGKRDLRTKPGALLPWAPNLLLHSLAPACHWPPLSPCCSHTSFLAVSQAHQACSHLKALPFLFLGSFSPRSWLGFLLQNVKFLLRYLLHL